MQSLEINPGYQTVSNDPTPGAQIPWVNNGPDPDKGWRQDLEVIEAIITELRTRREVEANTAEENLHRLELSSFRNWGINE